MSTNDIMLFSGNANPLLAESVAKELNIPLGKATVSKFSDGEITVEIKENVRGRDVFIIQSTCAPTNDNLMELIIIADALRRASANTISAVIPYFGYARQDRRVRSMRVPITAKIVANMIHKAGICRVLTVDLHAEQIQGFFDIPVDNIYSTPVLLEDMRQNQYLDYTVVSPDIGGVARARAVAKLMNNTELAIIDKRRRVANASEVMNIIGEVSGKNCMLVDDIIDTAGTLCNAARALKEKGANRIIAYGTHAVFSGKAYENIMNSPIDEIVVTDTIPLAPQIKACSKIRQLSLGYLLAVIIHRVYAGNSVSSIFHEINDI